MTKFRFLEFAVSHPSNRHSFDISKNVIQMPFRKQNRLKEFWRSMYLFTSQTPNENDPLLGNFYLETDEPSFDRKRDMFLDVCQYLNKKYSIPFNYFDFFVTNRSFWLSIPSKVFGCFGSRKLHLIHKMMAEEIQSYLIKKGYKKNIDLSIYKWNGLIHSLGSYLPNSERWVSKFSFYDLEDCLSIEQLLKVKYDNFFTLSDINVISKAKAWFDRTKQHIFGTKKKKTKHSSKKHSFIQRLEDSGYIEENRNLHIYSYALYLKGTGIELEDAIQKIQDTFSNDYVWERECIRTIESAYKGNKHLSIKRAQELLNPDLFSNDDFVSLTTFIVPRKYIEILHKHKVHYEVYKILLSVLSTHQRDRRSLIVSLQRNKYKKNLIDHFEKLKSLGLVSYTLKDDVITAAPLFNEDVYKSYIVVPFSLLESNVFAQMKKEIKVFLELLRCSLRKDDGVYFFNVKETTLLSKLRMTLKVYYRCVAFLKKNYLLHGKTICLDQPRRFIKQKCESIVRKIRESKPSFSFQMEGVFGYAKNCNTPSLTFFLNCFSFNHKMLYSLFRLLPINLELTSVFPVSLSIFSGSLKVQY